MNFTYRGITFQRIKARALGALNDAAIEWHGEKASRTLDDLFRYAQSAEGAYRILSNVGVSDDDIDSLSPYQRAMAALMCCGFDVNPKDSPEDDRDGAPRPQSSGESGG